MINRKRQAEIVQEGIEHQREVFMRIMSRHHVGVANKTTIDEIMKKMVMETFVSPSRETFQRTVLGYFRKQADRFVGTDGKGIFLIRDSKDKAIAMSWHIKRIQAEMEQLTVLSEVKP